MKRMVKVAAGILFAVGLLLIIGAVGTEDYYDLVLEEAHAFNWQQIVVGFLFMIPLPMCEVIGRDDD